MFSEKPIEVSFPGFKVHSFAEGLLRTLLHVVAFAVFLSMAPDVQAAETPYRLGVQDKVRIHVHEWPALSGEFTVGASGAVTVPLLGPISAVGLQPAELAAKIAEGLRKKGALNELPDATVDVAQYRPFYILGGVERPGEYSYRPGMLVLNAVSIAGGAYRPPTTDRDVVTINAAGDLRLAHVQKLALMAKELRTQGGGRRPGPNSRAVPRISNRASTLPPE